jgi:hypothetical protein
LSTLKLPFLVLLLTVACTPTSDDGPLGSGNSGGGNSDGGGGDDGGNGGGGDDGGGGGGGGGGGNGETGCGVDAGTSFRIDVYDVFVPDRAAGGSAWDIDGSFADPYVCVGPDTAYWGCSGVGSNTSSVAINTFFEGTVASSDEEIWIDVYDNDAADDDYIGGAFLRLENLRASTDCGLLTFGGTDFGVELVEYEITLF